MEIFWLLLLGMFTYLIVQRSVANVTRTPVWILWLVMMTPAFVWTTWIALNGDNEPIPLFLLIGPFVVCPILYWFLIQWGRPVKADSSESNAHQASSEQYPSQRLALAQESLISADQKPDVLRPIDKDEEATLKNCFSWSVFYLKTIEYRPQALICRGSLRTSPDTAYSTIRENIEAKFGNRFLVIFQEGIDGKPFFALVPNPQAHAAKAENEIIGRPMLAFGLLLTTLLTTTLAGIVISANLMSENSQLEWSMLVDQYPSVSALLRSGLPYALSLMAILGIHELGHYLTARRYRIKVTLPYFIPVPPALIFPFGTFGAFIQIRSPVPNRKALFDVGLAGPFAGFIVTIPVLIWGLAHSSVVPLTEESSILNFESFKPSASLLLAIFSRFAMGDELTVNSAIHLHPVAIAGCLGVVVTALNLMPIGQLDGGHIVHAMLGQRLGAMIGQISRFLVLGLSFVQREFFLWAILLFFIPVIDEPTLNDVTELDNMRDFVGLLALALLVIIVLPAPVTVMQVLF